MLCSKTRIILFLLCLALLAGPAGLALAQVNLEIDFPRFGGQDLEGSSDLAQVIKYGANVFMVGAVVAVVLSLIYAGFVYTSSAGRPAQLAQARKRVLSAFLGLAIVASSYLILRVVNPDFVIVRFNKVPIITGVLLLNDKAFDNATVIDNLMSNNETTRNEQIKKLIDGASEEKAVYLTWEARDLQQKFGDLVVNVSSVRTPQSSLIRDDRDLFNGAPYNFENFKLSGIFFLPNANKRVSSYYFANFRNWYWAGDDGHLPDNQYTYPDCSALSGGPCRFKLLDGISNFCTQTGKCALNSTRYSAPLSLRVEHLGQGVILRGEEFGEELSVLDFSDTVSDLGNLRFDDKAKEIEIRNWSFTHFQNQATGDNELRGEQTSNYLAVLYEDPFFRGKLRLFFEKFFDEVSNQTRGNLTSLQPVTKTITVPGGTLSNAAFLFPSQLAIDDTADAYGRVNKPSSVQVFQMPQTVFEKSLWELNGGCSIWFCAQQANGVLKENFFDCLIYRFPSLTSGADMGNPTPAQLFLPFNLPQTYEITTTEGQKTVQFNDNIRSLRIEGDCLVALFEHGVNEAQCEFCADEKNLPASCNACWTQESPGGHSEIFSPNDSEYPYYLDLTPESAGDYIHNIGTCRKFKGITFRPHYYPCASAFMVLPLKR